MRFVWLVALTACTGTEPADVVLPEMYGWDVIGAPVETEPALFDIRLAGCTATELGGTQVTYDDLGRRESMTVVHDAGSDVVAYSWASGVMTASGSDSDPTYDFWHDETVEIDAAGGIARHDIDSGFARGDYGWGSAEIRTFERDRDGLPTFIAFDLNADGKDIFEQTWTWTTLSGSLVATVLVDGAPVETRAYELDRRLISTSEIDEEGQGSGRFYTWSRDEPGQLESVTSVQPDGDTFSISEWTWDCP